MTHYVISHCLQMFLKTNQISNQDHQIMTSLFFKLLKSEQTIKLFELNHRKFTRSRGWNNVESAKSHLLRTILEPPMKSTHPTSSHKTLKETTDQLASNQDLIVLNYLKQNKIAIKLFKN
jgi:hypothetical protein